MRPRNECSSCSFLLPPPAAVRARDREGCEAASMSVRGCRLEATNKKPATAEAGRAKLATGDREWTYGCRGVESRQAPQWNQDRRMTQRKPFCERLQQPSAGIVRLYVWITASVGHWVVPPDAPRHREARKESGRPREHGHLPVFMECNRSSRAVTSSSSSGGAISSRHAFTSHTSSSKPCPVSTASLARPCATT